MLDKNESIKMTQQELDANDYYSTTDLALAAAISLQFPIEAVDKTNPHKALFLFKRDEHLDQLIEIFWKKELRVDPLTYFNQLKTIKSRLYAER